MINRFITPYMRQQADVLLARSSRWSRGYAQTPEGATVNIVTFASSRQRPDGRTVMYMTRVDGACCSCPGFVARQACSHALACKLEAEAARAAVGYRPRTKIENLLDEWADSRTTAAF